MGGSLSSQDIEFITWEFLIEKVKEVTSQLNEVIAQNQSLIKTNTDLQQERDVLTRELNQVKDNNTRLTQDNLQLRASKNSLESELRRTLDRIQPLEIDNNQLYQEKTQLERKLYELNSLNSNSRQLETKLKQLEGNARELEKAKISLELQLKEEKNKVALLEQKIKILQIENRDEEINRLLAKIDQLEEIIRRLRDGHDDEISLLEYYNDLVYFVQTSLATLGIEELDDWEKTEEFYIELISRLCFIDTILVTKIRSLEYELHPVYNEYIAVALADRFSYPGKFLFWSNGERWW